MSDEKKTVAFVLRRRHVDIVKRLARGSGEMSLSAAMRRIIEEWDRHQPRTLVDTPAPYTPDYCGQEEVR